MDAEIKENIKFLIGKVLKDNFKDKSYAPNRHYLGFLYH